MRRSKQRRKQKTPKPPEKAFKYLVRCIGCAKVFLLAKGNSDLSKLRCDVCKSELEYTDNINPLVTPHQHNQRSKKMAKGKKKEKKQMETGDKARRIKQLLVDLEKSNDQGKNRKIRKQLRLLGHVGGLNKPCKVSKKKASKKKKSKAA